MRMWSGCLLRMPLKCLLLFCCWVAASPGRSPRSRSPLSFGGGGGLRRFLVNSDKLPGYLRPSCGRLYGICGLKSTKLGKRVISGILIVKFGRADIFYPCFLSRGGRSQGMQWANFMAFFQKYCSILPVSPKNRRICPGPLYGAGTVVLQCRQAMTSPQKREARKRS